MGISVDILSVEGMLAWGLHNVDGWQARATETTCLTCWSDDPRNEAEMRFGTEATSVGQGGYFRGLRKLLLSGTEANGLKKRLFHGLFGRSAQRLKIFYNYGFLQETTAASEQEMVPSFGTRR